MGVEAAGVIEAVGAGVTGFADGDRVTYTGSPLGAYSTERVMPPITSSSCRTPSPFDTAAMTMRGLSAAYLLRRIARLKAGDTILLHAAAGGVGLIVSQWAKLLGLNVIGTVSTEAKAAVARRTAATRSSSTAARTSRRGSAEITDGEGVPVVYDTVGKDTFQSSIDSLARRGLLVCFGTASGPVPPIDALQLAIKGSVYFTRPALADYIADPGERAELAGALFDHVGAGRIKIEINQRYALDDAVQAHRDLEAGAASARRSST